MKCVYLSSLFMACALVVGAQEAPKGIYQFEDPGFEQDQENWTVITKTEESIFGSKTYTYKEPGRGWHSFASADGDYSGGSYIGMSPEPQLSDGGYNGSKHAILLKSLDLFIAKANGNLTTGRVHMGNTDGTDKINNYNYSDIKNGQCLQFAGRPDAVKFYAKFNPGKGNNGAGEGKPAGRGQFILHKATTGDDIYKDPENDDLIDKYRVAIASVLIDNTDNDWHLYSGEFNYDKNLAPETRYMLASFTTNPNPGESGGDELTIDDVYFVYYSDLKSLTYDGLTFEGSALSPQEDGKVKVDFSSKIYKKDNPISYELKGKGAEAELGEFDKFTSTVTLTVYGDDYGQNINGEVSDNKTVYVLQFAKPEVDEKVLGKYKSLINVTIGNKTFPSVNTVIIENATNGTVNFRMNDFEFGGKPVGNITLTNAALYYDYEGTDDLIHITAREQNLELGDGTITAQVSLEDGQINKQKELTAIVPIQWFQGNIAIPIYVQVCTMPFNAVISVDKKTLTVTGNVAKDLVSLVVPAGADVNAIDLTGANLESEMATSDFGVKNSNTLFYVDAEETNLTGDNVVKGTECENLVLTDGLTFNAPKGFAAANVTFNREFKAGQLSTVVLPFSFDATNVNGTVYKLESVDDGVLSFKSVNGTAEANVPYLVQTEGDNLFNGTLTKATVAQTPETVENSITGTGITHVGNFGETMNIASDDQTSWYGYTSEGKFVKVSDGTIKPFRTAIKSTSATTQNSFALKLDGTVTGILNLENPNAKVDVYTVSGVCVRKNVPAASALNGLSRGVYIVGGQKVVK